MDNSAVITGAARGLGKAFSYELSKKGYNTILIDLPEKGLKNICADIESKNKNKSLFYETDLRKIENVIDITNDINKKHNVSILVNNARVGGEGVFRSRTIWKYIPLLCCHFT